MHPLSVVSSHPMIFLHLRAMLELPSVRYSAGQPTQNFKLVLHVSVLVLNFVMFLLSDMGRAQIVSSAAAGLIPTVRGTPCGGGGGGGGGSAGDVTGPPGVVTAVR